MGPDAGFALEEQQTRRIQEVLDHVQALAEGPRRQEATTRAWLTHDDLPAAAAPASTASSPRSFSPGLNNHCTSDFGDAVRQC